MLPHPKHLDCVDRHPALLSTTASTPDIIYQSQPERLWTRPSSLAEICSSRYSIVHPYVHWSGMMGSYLIDASSLGTLGTQHQARACLSGLRLLSIRRTSSKMGRPKLPTVADSVQSIPSMTASFGLGSMLCCENSNFLKRSRGGDSKYCNLGLNYCTREWGYGGINE